MYLRFGWVVGQTGLTTTLLIVGVSHLITIATGLSIASIATNRTIGAGGAYYMISRSLGAPSGAAIGLPLFFGQALSVSFYVVGFAESVTAFLPDVPLKAIAAVACLVLAAVALKSAAFAIKVQYVVMAAIGLSLVAFFTGRGPNPPETIQWVRPAGGESFATAFAVFFPAVTGIMAGVGMSGDLKDARKALPIGTMAAVFVGLVVYSVFPFWLAMNATSAELVENQRVVWDISSVPALIYVGVWGATLSSAVGSLLIAPRTLQALARDGLMPKFLGRGSGEHDEPRLGVAVTLLLAAGGIFLGNLNAIANLLTMFFLATYGLTNLACGLERWAASPAFRPQFRVHWGVSIFGAVACFYVMSIIDLPSMMAALAVCGGIYVWTQRRVLGTAYGDARHGIWAALVRTALHQLRRAEFHPANWRPNLVIMGGDIERRPYLLELGSTIVQDQGVVTYFQLLEGTVAEHAEERRRLLRASEGKIAADFPTVFYRVDVVADRFRGIVATAQGYGMGSFEANTVMLGWPHQPERYAGYAQMVRELVLLDRSLLLMHFRPEKKFGFRRRIDIWWGGLQGNGGLMLLLAFLITAHDDWRGARVFLVVVVSSEGDLEVTRGAVESVVRSSRVNATPRIVVREGRAIHEIMRTESENADLAIVGTALPDPEHPEQFFERMNPILDALPTTLLVHSARSFSGEPVLFQDEQDASRSPD